ncbi:MAG: YbgA family protein [bacterium]
MDRPRPRILVSKCINLAPLRYNGGIVKDEFAAKLYRFVDLIPVCPEVAIGLGVPRPRVILVKENDRLRFYQPETKLDLTDKIENFSVEFTKNLPEIDGALLKAKSPSCGVSGTSVYGDREGKNFLRKSKGLFAQRLIEGFKDIPIEDEGRLHDDGIREHFLERIFALAELRGLKENSKGMKDLVAFHSRYKYFIMSYSQKALKQLGNIVANREKRNLKDVLSDYIDIFKDAVKRRSTRRNNANVMLHIVGHLSDRLNKSEKEHFTHLVELYKDEKIEKRVIVELLRNYSFRFGIGYITDQAYLSIYPEDLASY